MPKPKTNFAELTHQAVREAADPLTMDELVAQVLRLSGGESTKHIKQTIRGALNSSSAIIATSDGRYAWKSRLLNGVVQRIILHDEDLAERELLLDDLQRDLLRPNGFNDSKYGVAGDARLELAGGPTVIAPTVYHDIGEYTLAAGDLFWAWVDAQGAQPGDSLLLTAVDVEARQYRLSYEPAGQRDEAAIAARGQQLIAAAVAYVHKRKGSTSIMEIAGHLNASGVLHHIPAPDPFEQLWAPQIWMPLAEEYDVSPFLVGGRTDLDMLGELISDMIGGPQIVDPSEPAGVGTGPIFQVGDHGSYQGDLGVDPRQLQDRIDAILAHPERPVPADDPLLPAITTVFASMALPSPSGAPYPASQLVELFGDSDEVLDWIDHGVELGMVQIDPAYEALLDEDITLDIGPFAALAEPEPRSGTSRALTLRVTYRYSPEHWREIEIADDQYLSDLHMAIQRAFDWGDDHLYAFYMGKRPYDTKNEIGGPGSEARRQARRVTIGELELRTKQKFLYLFDFGDDHLFDIQVLKINPKAPPGVYPRVVAEHGGHLAQYPGEEDWDEDDDVYEDE